MKTSEAAAIAKMSVQQFRRHARRYGIVPKGRNDWVESDVKRGIELLSLTQLRSRKWTKKLIKEFAGKPDAICPNPKYVSASPMKLYYLVRIEDIERTEEFSRAQENASKRSQRALETAQEMRERTLAWANEVPIQVTRLQDVVERACEHYNSRSENRATLNSDPEFLDRISVNFLRHRCSSYEKQLEAKFGKIGADAAYVRIKERTLEAIQEAYPEYDEECNKQILQLYKTQ